MALRFYNTALILGLCCVGMGPAYAADDSVVLTTQSNTMDQVATAQNTSKVTSQFASDFTTFTGSQESAEAMITGLRQGTPILLTGTTGSTTITPPTKPMGYGNTYISMSLAKAQLAQYGIVEPTPEQLNTALTGGTLTATTIAADGTVITKTVTLDGILTQRASGMGWGQIAKANGFKLGEVISGMKSANQRLASTPIASGSASVTSATSKKVAGSQKQIVAGSEAKSKYAASSRSITTPTSGGGIIYGKQANKSEVKLVRFEQHMASRASHGQGAGLVNASGSASALSNGKSASAPGQNKAGK